MWCDRQNTHIINDNFCMTWPPCEDKLNPKTELPRRQFKFEIPESITVRPKERASYLLDDFVLQKHDRKPYNSKLLYSGTRKLVSSEGQVLCADDERIGGNVQICSRVLREITRLNMSAPIWTCGRRLCYWTWTVKTDNSASVLLACITLVSFV